MNFIRRFIDEQSKVLLKNSSWIFLDKGYRVVLHLLRGIILARLLGPEFFGLYAIVLAFVGTVQEFLNPNLGTTIIKFGAGYLKNKEAGKLVALVKGSFWTTFITNILSILVIWLVITFFYDTFLDKPGLGKYIMAFALVAGTNYLNYISFSLLRLNDRFKFNSIIYMIMTSIEFCIVVGTVWFNPHDLDELFTALIIARALNTCIVNGAAFYELRRLIAPHLKIPLRILRPDWKSIRNFTLSNSGSRTIQTIMQKGDVLLLGALTGPEPVAFYAIAKRIANSVLLLTDPIALSVFPQLSKLVAAGKYREIKTMLFRISGMLLVPGTVFLMALFFFRYELVRLLFGAAYLPAAYPLVILMGASTIAMVFFWRTSLLLSLGYANRRLLITFIAVSAGFAIAWACIPEWGASGLAIAYFITVLMITISFILTSFIKIWQGIKNQELV